VKTLSGDKKNPAPTTWPRWAATVLLLGALTGCDRGEIKVYRVAKEAPTTPEHDHTAPDLGKPHLTWKTPATWTEVAPGQMRLASFKVKTADGKLADISVIPLPGLAGGDAPNVNRWRGQVGLPEATPEEIEQAAESVTIGGRPAKLHNLAGTNTASGEPTRILAAISTRGDTTWFFKITGDDALVAAQKPAMLEFLQSLDFNSTSPAALPPNHPPIGSDPTTPTPTTGPISREGQPTWQVPTGWTEVPGGQFLVAKFTITGVDAAQAAVNVSRAAGEGGGLAGNVNRWRKQLGLAEFSTTELERVVKSLKVVGGKAALVEFSGTDSRSGQPAALVAAIVTRDGVTWFYKLMGAASAVAGQKAAFEKFVSEVKY